MGKKYLDTKKNSLESSILGVWKTAVEEGAGRMDGRTSEYREHRKKLESARARREEKKVAVKKEEPETINGAGEHAFEVGTDRYAEYTKKITPGQIDEEIAELDVLIKELEEGILGNIAKAAGKSVVKGVKVVRKKAVGAVKRKVGGTAVGKAFSKVKSGVKKVKSVGSKIKKAAKTGKAYGDDYNALGVRLETIESKLNIYYEILETKLEELKLDEGPFAPKKVTKKERDSLEDKNEHGLLALKLVQAYGTPNEVQKIKDINKRHKNRGHITHKDQKERDAISGKYYYKAEELKLDEKKVDHQLKIAIDRVKNPNKALLGGPSAKESEKILRTKYKYTDKMIAKLKEETELDETAVNPKDREELDKAPSDTAKKMKRAQEPEPGQVTEASGDKEAYKKFFNSALKKFKVGSPAELKGDQKKKFYDYVDKNWEADNEKAEGAMSQVREFKIQSMKAALAQVWGMKEGHNPFKKENNEKKVVKDGKTETGKKAAVIDLKPKIKD